jgi:hypothetical protein
VTIANAVLVAQTVILLGGFIFAGVQLRTVMRERKTAEALRVVQGMQTADWVRSAVGTRLRPWIERDRERTGNQKSFEWFQWLAERLQGTERTAPPGPAHRIHMDWRP